MTQSIQIPRVQYVLRDGTEVILRSVKTSDKVLLIKGLGDMSPESRYYRFNSSSFKLTAASLKYLTDVNYTTHVAIGAGVEKKSEEIGIGIGRYIRNSDSPREAEVALAVIDAFQRQGVGTALLKCLSRCASLQGVDYFVAHIHASRRDLIQRLVALGTKVEGRSANVLKMRIPVCILTSFSMSQDACPTLGISITA